MGKEFPCSSGRAIGCQPSPIGGEEGTLANCCQLHPAAQGGEPRDWQREMTENI